MFIELHTGSRADKTSYINTCGIKLFLFVSASTRQRDGESADEPWLSHSQSVKAASAVRIVRLGKVSEEGSHDGFRHAGEAE